MRSLFVRIAALAALASFAPAAAADVVERSAARALFEQARDELQRGEFDAACQHFATSKRLEPAVGTTLNLALCYEKQGKTASAFLEYEETLALSLQAADVERESIARARLTELEPRLSRIQIALPDDAPEGWFLTLDGTSLTASALVAPFPVDGGPHVIRFGAPGYRTAEFPLHADLTGHTSKLDLPSLARVPAPIPLRPRTHGSRPVPSPAPALGPDWSWFGAGIAFGVGAATATAGSCFGLRASASWQDRNEHCSAAGCQPEGMSAGRDARDAARISNVAFSIAVLAVATGVTLLFSDSASGRPARSVPLRRAARAGGTH